MLTRDEIHAVLVERHGEAVQAALDAARVGIAGLGGLGSNVAVSLARIGVGHLHLVDFDVVDPSNLNRQQYFMHQLGMNKTDALAENLRAINPYLDITTTCTRITAENAAELFTNVDIVCEAFDVPENKAMLVNTVLEELPRVKLVAASGMAGYGNSNAIVTRQIGSRLWLCGDGETESRPGAGLMAPRVAICANHEANKIVELILAKE